MMKLLFSLIFVSSIGFASQEMEITIPSAVEVSPRNVLTAYDIVEAKNLNEDAVSDLKDITIVKDKATNLISKAELAKMFRSVKARFIFPNELKIIRSQSSISRMEVERKIKNKMYSQCAGCEIHVQISSVPNNMDSDWNMDLDIDLSKNTVMIPIYARGGSSNKGWVVAEIKKFQNTPVLNRSAKMGDVLTEEMFNIEKRLLSQNQDTVLKLEAIVGMQAARFLSAGQTIQFSDIKREVILKKGQIVKAMVGNTDFEVSISAEAQENGSVGDVVKIKNLDSQKVFAAKIIGRGLVRIE